MEPKISNFSHLSKKEILQSVATPVKRVKQLSQSSKMMNKILNSSENKSFANDRNSEKKVPPKIVYNLKKCYLLNKQTQLKSQDLIKSETSISYVHKFENQNNTKEGDDIKSSLQKIKSCASVNSKGLDKIEVCSFILNH